MFCIVHKVTHTRTVYDTDGVSCLISSRDIFIVRVTSNTEPCFLSKIREALQLGVHLEWETRYFFVVFWEQISRNIFLQINQLIDIYIIRMHDRIESTTPHTQTPHFSSDQSRAHLPPNHVLPWLSRDILALT